MEPELVKENIYGKGQPIGQVKHFDAVWSNPFLSGHCFFCVGTWVNTIVILIRGSLSLLRSEYEIAHRFVVLCHQCVVKLRFPELTRLLAV